MIKEQALFQFFNSAVPGVPAYPNYGVPSKARGDAEDVAFPYMTYTPVFSTLDEGPVQITVNLWHLTESEVKIGNFVQTLSNAIGRSGQRLNCDGGYIWLRRGNPFAQPIDDESNILIKGRYIIIMASFLTLD